MTIWAVLFFVVITGVFSAGITYLLMRRLPHIPPPNTTDIREGFVVLDTQQKIISLNSQIEHYVGEPSSAYTGKPYNTLLDKFDINERARADLENPRTELVRGKYVLETIDFVTQDETGNETGKIVLMRDITRYNRRQSRLENRLEKLAALRSIYSEISEKLDVSSVMMFALDGAMRLSVAEMGYIAVKQPDGQYNVIQFIGQTTAETINTILHSGKGVVSRVIRTERAEWISDVGEEPEFVESIKRTKSLIIIPIFTLDEEMIGVLSLATSKSNRFTEDVFEFMQLLSDRISVGVTNAQLYEQVQTQLEELRVSNAHITQLEKLKTEMIRIAAHDLGTPLSTILLRVQFMERLDRTADFQEFLDISLKEITQAAQNIDRLRRNILSLEKIEQLAISANITDTVNLYEQTMIAIDNLQSLSVRKKIQLLVDVSEKDKHIVYGEEDQLYEAITNLVSNAIKYTGKEGRVRISLQKENDHIMLRVEDNGYGIPQSAQENLFEPFQRIETEETKDIEGTGLGLHLVKKIIERHNGEIIFASEYGKGSTFGFKLAAVQDKNSPELAHH